MKVKQGNVYEKLGRLIAEYSTILERTDEKDLIDGKYLELTADEFKEVAKGFGIFCPQDYEMKETTVRLYRYLDDVLMLKIPDKDIINKMAEPSAWPLPGFFDKAYNCDRDVHVAGVDKLPRTPSEAEASLDKIKRIGVRPVETTDRHCRNKQMAKGPPDPVGPRAAWLVLHH